MICNLWLDWGDKGQLNGSDHDVIEMIKYISNLKYTENNCPKSILSMVLSKKGNPLHPLYMSDKSFLRPFGQKF